MNADPPENLEFFLALTLAASKAWLVVQREFKAAGVDPSNWGLLFHIAARDDVMPSQLAAETGVPPTTIRDQLQALVDRGLVERAPNPRDARSYLVRLTAAGRESLERGMAASQQARDLVEADYGPLDNLREQLLSFVHSAGVEIGRAEETDRVLQVKRLLDAKT